MDGIQIKKILKKYYPEANFKVQISKGLDKEIKIKTDLLKWDYEKYNRLRDLYLKACKEGLNQEETKKYEELEGLKAKDEEIKREIEKILKNSGIEEKIYRDEKTDEILTGGNIFIFIKPLK
jgi:hypothetical protein